MDPKRVYCNVCDLFLNSSDQYAVHLLGKQHARKAQSTGNCNIVTVNSLVNSNSTVVSNTTSTQVTVWPLPNNMSDTQPVPVSTVTEATALSSDSIITAQITELGHSNQGGDSTQTEKKPQEAIFCPVCFISLTSRTQAEVHFSGLKHKKAVTSKNQLITAGVKRKKEEYCDVCNVSLSSRVLAEAHYAGSKHEKRVKLAAMISTGTLSNTAQPTQSFSNLPAATLNGPSAVKQPKKELDPEMRAQLYCHCCNLAVNSLAQMMAHQSGNKHKQKARQLPSHRFQQFQFSNSTAAPGYHQQQFTNSSSYIPDLKSSFIFGETTGNIMY